MIKVTYLVFTKVFPGSRNLAPDSCVAIAIPTQESEARLHEPGKTLVWTTNEVLGI